MLYLLIALQLDHKRHCVSDRRVLRRVELMTDQQVQELA